MALTSPSDNTKKQKAMKVKAKSYMVTATRRIKFGEVVELPDLEAQSLIDANLAEKVGAAAPKIEKAAAALKAEKATAGKKIEKAEASKPKK